MSKPDNPVRWNQGWLISGICIFLAAITFLVFGQTIRAGFINYDDNLYVYDNPLVITGLAFPGIVHVLTHSNTRFYTPLTMISHMADCQFHGLWAGGHHLTNVLLHVAAAILLFLVLRQMTAATLRSAFVAAIFAIHPLHVESVAWVAERNDAPSGVFFMLTIAAYISYARQQPRSFARYLLVMAVFVMGLMSKPTLVTLPFVLLILDYWPLNRFAQADGEKGGISLLPGLLVEKIPLLVLSIGACFTAYYAEGKSVASWHMYPSGARIANALVSYVIYLRQMIWPSGLAVFYPRPVDGVPRWEAALALVVLGCISAGIFAMRKKFPYLITGWLWYLGVLVPMIGIIQVGEFAHADRFTYLSQIGLYIAVIWGGADLCHYFQLPATVTGITAMLLAGALIVCSRKQASYWHDSESLFRHALDCTTGNYVACNNLGSLLYHKGDVDGAIAIYQKGLEYLPRSVPLHNNIAQAFSQNGRLDDAIFHYQKALELDSDSAVDHFNLGNAFLQKREAAAAIGQWRRAMEINPQYMEAESNLAMTLATCPDESLRNASEAVELAGHANRISGGANPMVLYVLATAYAAAGRFAEAVNTAQRALQIAIAQHNSALAETLRKQIALYSPGLPPPDSKP